MKTPDASGILGCAAILLVAVGAALIYWPLGLIVAGLMLYLDVWPGRVKREK